jgi:hypothetical protein
MLVSEALLPGFQLDLALTLGTAISVISAGFLGELGG